MAQTVESPVIETGRVQSTDERQHISMRLNALSLTQPTE